MNDPLRHLNAAEPRTTHDCAGRPPHSRDRPIELIAFVPYPPDTTPSQRFRIEQWKAALEDQGIRVRLAPFADGRLMSLLHQPGHAAQIGRASCRERV